ncbi:MAG: CoA pyrophosphatase [Gammaproteobacteria bacterium]|nr:CoA pyrophosphatase [Gammaproteobacteria bacterium]
MHCLNLIRQRLAEARPNYHAAGEQTRQAAVAIILRSRGDATDMLFIKRAEKRGDPWSGHMAFPGGHLEAADADLRAAAQRETLEEIGLDLHDGEYLGALDHQSAMPRGRTLNMLIAPHVFSIEGDPRCTPNYEVQEVVWTSLERLMSNVCHDTETRPMAGRPTIFNGYRLERGHFVWGLTYRMLKSLFTAIDPQWQPPREL